MLSDSPFCQIATLAGLSVLNPELSEVRVSSKES